MTVVGRWRIVEMEVWDLEAIDLLEPGFIEFAPDGRGQLGFIAIGATIDWRAAKRDGRDAVEFSWEGHEEGDPVSGRGWAGLSDHGELVGHLYLHLGDDSSFRARPFDP